MHSDLNLYTPTADTLNYIEGEESLKGIKESPSILQNYIYIQDQVYTNFYHRFKFKEKESKSVDRK